VEPISVTTDDEDRRSGTTHVLVHACLRKVLEELELTEGPEAEERVFEGQDTLDRDLAACWFVDCGDDGAIRALAQRVGDLVVGT
jgi:hypothetical protein